MKKFKSFFALFLLFNLGSATNKTSNIFKQQNNFNEKLYSIKKINAGFDFSSIVLDCGDYDSLYTWGNNNSGQLGLGDLEYEKRPTELKLPIKGKIKFSYNSKVGDGNSAVVVNDGSKDHLYTWGKNDFGQLGLGYHSIYEKTPSEVKNLPEGEIKQISLGRAHSSAVVNDGSKDHLYTWGRNNYGQLGIGEDYGQVGKDDEDFYVTRPTEVTSLPEGEIKEVSLGGDHSSAVVNDGSKDHLYTWGNNESGQLGLGDKNKRNKPTEVTSPLPEGEIKEISNGQLHSSAVVNDGSKDYLYTWGSNGFGQLGIGNEESKNKPTKVTSLPQGKIKEVSLGNLHSSAVVNDGSKDHLYTWGNNNHGQLGVWDFENKNKPTEVTSPLPEGEIKEVSLGGYHSFAIVNDGTKDYLYTWGQNDIGQLGLGDNTDRKKPTEVKYYLNPYVEESFEIQKNTITHNSFNFSFNIHTSNFYINLSEEDIKTQTYLELNGQKFDAKFLEMDSSSDLTDNYQVKYNFVIEGLKTSTKYKDIKLHIGGTNEFFNNSTGIQVKTTINKKTLLITIISVFSVLIIIIISVIVFLIFKKKNINLTKINKYSF